MANVQNQLYRSRENRMVGGVCAGLGKFFGIDPTVVRLLFAFGAVFFGFPGALILIYIVMLIIVPEAPLEEVTNG
jgi:phage shock protein C